jgi:hypothetical protein
VIDKFHIRQEVRCPSCEICFEHRTDITDDIEEVLQDKKDEILQVKNNTEESVNITDLFNELKEAKDLIQKQALAIKMYQEKFGDKL